MLSRARTREVVRRRRTTVAASTALAVIAGILVAYAVNADGYPVHKAELNDGGVWVTNQAMGAIGRQNVPVAQIDARVFDGDPFVARTSLDVLQDGSAIVSVDRSTGSLMPVDAALGKGLDQQRVTAGGRLALLGGDSLASVDPTTGKVWATTVDPSIGAMSLDGLTADTRPLARAGGGAIGVAGRDGTVYVASTDEGRLVSLRRADDGPGFTAPTTEKLGADIPGALAQMSAVGGQPLMLDDKGNLATPDDALTNVGDGALLQQAGPDSSDVLVATPESLLAVGLDAGTKRVLQKVGPQQSAAAPVVMPGGCAFAAWGSGVTGTLSSVCDDRVQTYTFKIQTGADLVFRVNRNQVVLNDQKSGMTWDVTSGSPQLISNWEAFRRKTKQKDDKDSEKTEAETSTPPQANPDHLGVRDGRTSVLHVLDNDLIGSDGILSIVDVKGVTRDDVQVSIAPDRQTLLATVDPGVSGTVHFGYTISDGGSRRSSQDDGEVTLTVRDDAGSGTPKLRKHATAPTYSVTAGGVLEFPVTNDWRDADYGDPVVVQGARAAGGLEVSTTALGLVRVEAPAGSRGGLVTLPYTVTTGGPEAQGQAHVQVVPAGTQTVAPRAEPDVAAGEVDAPIVVKPLDNDIPGADGSDAGAHLELAGRVAPVGGLQVDTDRESGRVTVTGAAPGSYYLSYRAGFGAAERAEGRIRVDIAPASPHGDAPIAAPDTATVHGISPITVDVLANDIDPRGQVLVVQNARPSQPDSQLQVAVIDGRWVRVSAVDAAMAPASQSVTYTISNGSATAEGSINVTQRGALTGAANAPVAQTDRITVRAGDTATAPVLDNDATPSGDPVGLLMDPSVEPMGELRVLSAVKGDVGTAYVAGRQVRYVAPEKVTGAFDADVQYVVENTGDPSAETSIGTLKVHVTPPPSATNPDLEPTPRALEARVVQGDVVTLKLPPTGSDPDGDSVAITGVSTAPQLGRILAFGANSLTYQAYPDADGTDEFTYAVSDRFGERASGTVRVGVVEAGEPQAPLAVNDVWFADPSRTVDVDALGNDLRTPGTRVEIQPLTDAGAGVRLQSNQGPVSVHAPADRATRDVTYTISNGLAESRAVVSIKGREGYNNPPVTRDLYATPKPGADSVTVDVLAAVFDVDGAESDLKLDALSSGAGAGGKAGARIEGGKAVIPVKDVAQVVAYRVVDGEGAAAAAAIYVPARPTGAPYLKPGASITLKPGQTKDVDLSALVVDPEGDDVVLTTTDAISASPSDRLQVRGADKDTLTVSATKSEGPGSVVFEVSDRARLTDPEAHTAYISVPVQVGDVKPVINCPTVPIEVPEGGVSKRVDVASICHVWTADPAQARHLRFTSHWSSQPTDLSLDSTDDGVQILAGAGARRGQTGVVALGARGYDATGELLVRVVPLPAPRLAPIRLDTEAGKPVTVDVDGYLTSPLPTDTRQARVMKVTGAAGATAVSRTSGSKLTFTPKPDTHGVMRYRIEVSDVGGSTTSQRPRAAGDVTLAVVARPSAPTGLAAGQEMLANTVALTWRTPDNNGKRIDAYQVQYSGATHGTFACSGSPCRVTGLRNGDVYSFKVRAHNATQQNDGWSEWSNQAKATPDALTGPPLNPQVVLQRDRAVTVRWSPPATCDCSDVQRYRVSWPGGVRDVSATTRQTVVSAPNGDVISVRIAALNKKGLKLNDGPSTSVTGTGAGRPPVPGTPTLAPSNRPGNASKAIGISWAPVGANGPDPVKYQVQRTGGSGTRVVCEWTTATRCADEVTNDGTTYRYSVRAKNAEADSPRETTEAGRALHTSAYGGARSIQASAPPAPIRIRSLVPTGRNGEARIVFDVGASHGGSNTVTCSPRCGQWSFPTSGRTGVTRTLTGFTNGVSTKVTLKACNGATPTNMCVSDARSVVTYGPIGAISINATPDRPAVGDRTTNWSISVNPNGAPVKWVVRSSVNGIIAQGKSGNRSFKRSGGETLGYSTSVTYTLTVTDASGHGRAGKKASNGARTGAKPSCSNTPSLCPPPPTSGGGGGGSRPYLTFSQQAYVCGSTSSARACEYGMGSYYVYVSGHAFSSSSTCTASGPSAMGSFSLSNGQTEMASGRAFPGDTVRVSCGNGARGSYTVH